MDGTLEDLRQIRSKQQLGFSELEIYKVIWNISEVLKYLQIMKILHKNIKPENIFLSPTKGWILGDFGIAIDQLDIDKTKKECGTYCYMAPERHMGRTDIDSKADIFSLGVVAYFLATGFRPFDWYEPAERADRHKIVRNIIVHCEYMNPKAQELLNNRYLPLQTLIMNMLTTDRYQRIGVEDANSKSIYFKFVFRGFFKRAI